MADVLTMIEIGAGLLASGAVARVKVVQVRRRGFASKHFCAVADPAKWRVIEAYAKVANATQVRVGRAAAQQLMTELACPTWAAPVAECELCAVAVGDASVLVMFDPKLSADEVVAR